MKIRVTLQLELDADIFRRIYGEPGMSERDIRSIVRNRAAIDLSQSFSSPEEHIIVHAVESRTVVTNLVEHHT